MGGPPQRLYHGTWAGLAESVMAFGLVPPTREGWASVIRDRYALSQLKFRAETAYIHLASTPGLAWAHGALCTGVVMHSGIGAKDVPEFVDPAATSWSARRRVRSIAARALHDGGDNLVAVFAVDPREGLEPDPNTAAPALPWEGYERVAPCWRTRQRIDPSRIIEVQLFRVPELLEPGVVETIGRRTERFAHDYPRGHVLLEDLSPTPVGPQVPNGRRLVAAVMDSAGPAAELGMHGVPHWARVAQHGLDLHPGADLIVVLLFAMLHDARRRQDGRDDGHGRRAARLGRKLNGDTYELAADQLEQLEFACAQHTKPAITADPTVGACWDADRLDLVRYGARHDPELFSTARGRALAMGRFQTETPPLADVLDAYARRLDSDDRVADAA